MGGARLPWGSACCSCGAKGNTESLGSEEASFASRSSVESAPLARHASPAASTPPASALAAASIGTAGIGTAGDVASEAVDEPTAATALIVAAAEAAGKVENVEVGNGEHKGGEAACSAARAAAGTLRWVRRRGGPAGGEQDTPSVMPWGEQDTPSAAAGGKHETPSVTGGAGASYPGPRTATDRDPAGTAGRIMGGERLCCGGE